MVVVIGIATLFVAATVVDRDVVNATYGLDTATHARKVHPWTVRLAAADEGLRDALERRDRAAVVRGLEDVWFWIGRVVCDTLSAVDDPVHASLGAEAASMVIAVHETAGRARRFLGKARR